ncbi:nuclear transport factor 2 family protein [Ligilactobacillus sp. WILCCON 0076]|uniref:Nuclear transport factor 2 family protein n=1 Tax=Ligilactobacillus ubinensis TaxID=2876789 RepID=A0A9X2FGH9_9LACO|nr:nuclear transport factor 2 family protein [Ligilactobacillus ubinensis]MCP0885977.1 nuclear transport factor 2 family protein [Ligilactobacillus ubinensis]
MRNEYRKKLIAEYFQMWVQRDFSKLDAIFDTNIFYRECYGACYQNLDEIHLWVRHQLEKQVVLDWAINTVNIEKNYFFVTWTFHAKEKSEDIFDGISKIRFNDSDKISEIIEYETKHEIFYPFSMPELQ